MKKLLRFPLLNIAIILGITVFFGLQLGNLKLDNDLSKFLPLENETRKAIVESQELFGNQQTFAVSIKNPYGTIFEKEFLTLIDVLSTEFSGIELTESVMSLTSTDFVEGSPEGMNVISLVPENFSGTEAEISLLKTRLLDWDVYRDVLYSDDFKSTQILISMKAESFAEQKPFYESVKKIVTQNDPGNIEIYLAGEPVVNVLISTNMQKDLSFLIPLVILVVVLSLFFSFRRLSGVILPLLTVIISTIWTMGFMAVFKIELSLIASVIPVLMIAIGSAYGIHVITHYFEYIDKEKALVDKKKNSFFIFDTLRHVGSAVLMAGLTTMAGFISLVASDVLPIKTFGIFTSIGVFVAVIISLIFIPSLLLIRKNSLKKTKKEVGNESHSRFAYFIYNNFVKHKSTVIIISLILFIVAGIGTSMIIKDNDLIGYFKKDTEIVRADTFINQEFSGTNSFNIIIKGEKPSDLLNPEILKAMDELGIYLVDEFESISKIASYSDFIRRMNKTMHYPDGDYPFDIPIEFLTADVNNSNADSFSFDSSESFDSDFGDGVGDGVDSTEGFGGDFGEGFDSNEGFGTDEEFGFSDFSSFSSTSTEKEEVTTTTTLQDNSAAATLELMLAAIQESTASFSGASGLSGADLAQSLLQSFNYQGSAYDEIPYDPAKYPAETREDLKNLIAQYLLLFSGNVAEWADDDLEPTTARMTVLLNEQTGKIVQAAEQAIYNFVDARFPEGYTVTVSGQAFAAQEVTNLITSSQIRSILISLIIVFIILAVYFKSLYAGIFGLIPLSLAILLNFGIMGFFGINLDIATAMVASIAIGIGIDYTIHFLSTYREKRQQFDSEKEAILATLSTTGKAIVFNALSVGLGFAVLLLSQFVPLNYLGALIAITMLSSSLASLTLLPVLILIFKPRFARTKKLKIDTETSDIQNT